MSKQLFRVWCNNKKEWESDTVLVDKWGRLIQVRMGSPRVPLQAETHVLELAVGIVDKTNKPMYAGDIARYSNHLENGIAVIEKWDTGMCAVWINQNTKIPSIVDSLFHLGCPTEWEILGNIHENPELLEA